MAANAASAVAVVPVGLVGGSSDKELYKWEIKEHETTAADEGLLHDLEVQLLGQELPVEDLKQEAPQVLAPPGLHAAALSAPALQVGEASSSTPSSSPMSMQASSSRVRWSRSSSTLSLQASSASMPSVSPSTQAPGESLRREGDQGERRELEGVGVGADPACRQGKRGCDSNVAGKLVKEELVDGAKACGEEDSGSKDEDELAGDVHPINAFSLQEKLPAGVLYSAISRIRGTINKYANQLSEADWVNKFKMPTMKALSLRFSRHQGAITEQSNADIGIAYYQLKDRLASLIDLQKGMVAWSDSQNPSKLADIVPPMNLLQRYLDAVGLSWSAELGLLRQHALFHLSMNSGSSMVEAMQAIDMDVLTWCHSQLEQEASRVPRGVQTKEEPEEEEATQEDAEGACDPTAAANTMDLKATPLVQVSFMLASPVQRMIHALPKNINGDSKEFTSFLETLLVINERMDGIASAGGQAGCEFHLLVEAMAQVARCSLPLESERPDLDSVRSARKTIISMVSGTDLTSGVAKSFTTFDGGRRLMERAKLHAAGGIQDQTASELFSVASSKFESRMGRAFDDVDTWLSTGHGGQPHTAQSFQRVALDSALAFACDALHVVEQWSSAALQKKRETMADLVSNIVEVVRLGVVVAISTVSNELGHACRSLAPKSVGGVDSASAPSSGHVLKQVKTEPRSPRREASARGELQQPPSGGSHAEASDMSSVQPLLTILPNLRTNLHLVMNTVGKVHDALCHRLGESYNMLFEEGDRLAVVAAQVESSMSAVTDMVSYVLKCEELYCTPSLIIEAALSAMDQSSYYITSLSEFCELHRKLIGDVGKDIFCQAIVDTADLVGNLVGALTNYVSAKGAETYNSHVGTSVSSWVAAICQASVKVHAIHVEAMSATPLRDLAPMLLADSVLHELAPKDAKPFENQEYLASFDVAPHNKALKLLGTFVEAISLEQLVVLNVVGNGGGEAEHAASLPISVALFVLRVICKVRDLAALSALVHVRFLEPACDETKTTKFPSTTLFGLVANSIHLHHVLVDSLEALMKSLAAIDFERGGWQAATPLAVLRQWCESMAHFGGRCERTLLRCLAEGLTQEVEKCNAACPSWEAAFESGRLCEELASKLLSGKSAGVVLAHNKVHGYIAQMKHVATVMDINPPLAKHEATQETLAIAMNMLANAGTTNVVLQGYEIWKRYQNHPLGSDAASQFLDKNQKARAEKRAIPSGFWEMMEDMRSHAGHAAKQPTPSPMKGKSSPTSKKAVSEASAASEADSSTTTVPNSATPTPSPGSAQKKGLKRLRRE